jgi:hypothetical protein
MGAPWVIGSILQRAELRDPQGELEPQAFLCTDLDADPLDILRWFIRRRSTEVTFAQVHRRCRGETSLLLYAAAA